MKSQEKRRNQLTARLAELTARLEGIEEVLDVAPNPDTAERVSERESDEVLEGLGGVGEQEIRMIKAALARMDAGSYGYCVECGEAISEERLDLVPYTPFCRDCATRR